MISIIRQIKGFAHFAFTFSIDSADRFSSNFQSVIVEAICSYCSLIDTITSPHTVSRREHRVIAIRTGAPFGTQTALALFFFAGDTKSLLVDTILTIAPMAHPA